jgi:hypothetical protein
MVRLWKYSCSAGAVDAPPAQASGRFALARTGNFDCGLWPAGDRFRSGAVLQPFWALLISAHNVSAYNVSAGGASSNLRAAVLPSSRLIAGRSTSDARAMCETSDT